MREWGFFSRVSDALFLQNWLTLCAELVSKTSKKHMSWVTPLGLPVVQPYRRQVNVYEKASKKKAKTKTPELVTEEVCAAEDEVCAAEDEETLSKKRPLKLFHYW